MSEERHFRARVPREKETGAAEIAPPRPVDVIVSDRFSQKFMRPSTDAGREFLRVYYWHPLDYVDQPIEIHNLKHWQMVVAALKREGLRAQFDESGNHREVE